MSTTTTTDRTPCDKRRVLITDDETPVRDIFRIVLSSSLPDITFDVASNGLEAIQSFQQHRQGLLLMDMKMPVMDGPTAFQKIRDLCNEKGWEPPAVIFCTGFTPLSGTSPCIIPGCNYDVIQKPVSGEMLLTAVKKHLPPAE